MASMTDMAFAPLTMVFRVAYKQPWLAVGIAAVAGLVAHLMDHDGWTVLFVSFLSYMLMWLDETRHPRAAEQGSVEE